MKTYIFLLLTMTLINLTSYASNWSLVTSLTNSGVSAGGIRYDFKNNFVVDGGVSYHKSDKKESAYWVDAYYKNLGVFLSYDSLKLDKITMITTDNITIANDIYNNLFIYYNNLFLKMISFFCNNNK